VTDSGDIPKSFRPSVAIVAAIVMLGGVFFGALTAVRAEAQTAAREVIASEFAQKVKAEAVDAAVQAVRAAMPELKLAVREAVQEVALEQAKHKAMDDQRHIEEDRRLDRIERSQK
jgi:hypothetical protein